VDAADLNPDLVGLKVLDARGQRIGRVACFYRDLGSSSVCFAAVTMIRHGRRRLVFVPLVDATLGPGSLTVRCGAQLARRGPQTRPGHSLPAHLEPDLYTHFDLPYGPTRAGYARLQRCGDGAEPV
jgi:hypothetical protein